MGIFATLSSKHHMTQGIVFSKVRLLTTIRQVCGGWHKSFSVHFLFVKKVVVTSKIKSIRREEPRVSVNTWQAGGAVSKVKDRKKAKKKNQIHISFCAIHVSSSSADCFHTLRSVVGAAPTLPLCASYLASREGNSIFNWCYFRIFASSCDTSPGCWCEWHCWEALLIRRWQIITIICALCACVRVSQWPVCTACHFFNYSSCG